MKIITGIFVALFATMSNAAVVVKATDKENTLRLVGPIAYGDSLRLAEKFSNDITRIELQSGGGLAKEGQKIAQMIYERGGIETNAIGQCESACGVIWLAGASHADYAEDAGRVGFHLSYIPDISVLERTQSEKGHRGLEQGHKAGVLQDVGYAFVLTNNKDNFLTWVAGIYENGLLGNQMWYPTEAELRELEE